QIERVEPDNVSWLAQDGRPRVTLITCTEWDNDSRTYQGRLIVVAEPAIVTAQNP
ncbi:MAG: sortase, partial [Chloroflexi bacterium]|nr:sortase [Chloroflexota bacterium]